MSASDGFYESEEWLKLRYRVLKRANGCCQLCGSRGGPGNVIQVDHIKPRSKHPELALVESNMQVLCQFCNIGKSNTDETDWRFVASAGLASGMARSQEVLASCNPLERELLESIAWMADHADDLLLRLQLARTHKAMWQKILALKGSK